jgi:hypothetical protein
MLAKPFVFCCRVNPAEGDGQKIIAVFVGVMLIESKGAPGICTTESKLQKPPVMEYWPLVRGPPASGWPIVPLTV